MLAAHAVTTIHYLVQKELGTVKTRHVIAAILKVFEVAAVNGAVIQEALEWPLSDFEDAVTAAAARVGGLCVHRDARSPRIPRITGPLCYAGGGDTNPGPQVSRIPG